MFDVDEPISDYQKVIRERASQSLGPLRYAFNSPVKSPGKYKGDAYSSAVTRLKTLLQQYNESKIAEPIAAASQPIRAVPERSYLPSTDEVTQLLNNQFTVLQYLEGQVEFYKDALESLKQRAELVITENENLFDQLKTQAISQLLSTGEQSKSEELFPPGLTPGDPKQGLAREQTEDSTINDDENDDMGRQEPGTSTNVLHEHSKGQTVTGLKKMDREIMRTKELGSNDTVQSERDPRRSLMPSVMQRSALESSFGIDTLDSQLFMSANERKLVNQLEEEVEKIRKLHEAKTRHLESLLYSTRDELEDYQRQVSELQAKLRAQKVLEDQRGQPALCVKCGHHSAVLSNTHSEAAIDTINQLTKERDDLMNMLTGQKAVLAEVRQREFEAYNQVKKSCHMVEQAQLEKAEAIIHVRQLREDLRKGRERHENNMRMFSEKMDKEREKVKEACWEEVSGLNKQIESSSEARSALENQLERLTREKVGLMAELEQANSQILANASEVSKVS